MARLVPTIQTKYNKSQFIIAMVNAWIKQFNEIPSKEAIGIIYAQNSLESGETKYMWNNNIGNVKYIPSANMANDNVDYMMLKDVWEILNGKKIYFQPPHRQTWFRSFPTLEEGLMHHLDTLKNKRFKNSWGAVLAGDPVKFSVDLKNRGYYTAPLNDYIKLMNHFYNQYMKSSDYENALNPKAVESRWKKISDSISKWFK